MAEKERLGRDHAAAIVQLQQQLKTKLAAEEQLLTSKHDEAKQAMLARQAAELAELRGKCDGDKVR